jgi:hypothetical protein
LQQGTTRGTGSPLGRVACRKRCQVSRAFEAAEKLNHQGYVTGHGFSRAEMMNEMNRALAPAILHFMFVFDASSRFFTKLFSRAANAAKTRGPLRCGKTQSSGLCNRAWLQPCRNDE